MDYRSFAEKYALKLNRQQEEAVRSVEGNVLLLAVPGSGKTTVLVARLGYALYCLGVAPENILTMTYTVAAAALRGVGTEQDAEEAAADAFVYLWEHPEKLDPRRGSLKTWLSVVARSRALDRSREILRCRAVSLEEIELADPLGVPEALLAGERRAALNAAVDALAEPDREILLRRYYFGQKPREIAAALGLDKKQVDNRLYQTKRRLRASVTGAEGE